MLMQLLHGSNTNTATKSYKQNKYQVNEEEGYLLPTVVIRAEVMTEAFSRDVGKLFSEL